MHIFAPERPKLPNGRPALLLEGSAVPVVSVVPREVLSGVEWVDLVVYLRNFGETAERSYSYKNRSLPLGEVSGFFNLFLNDPEGALLHYFAWQDQAPPKGQLRKASRAISTSLAPDPMMDLLG